MEKRLRRTETVTTRDFSPPLADLTPRAVNDIQDETVVPLFPILAVGEVLELLRTLPTPGPRTVTEAEPD